MVRTTTVRESLSKYIQPPWAIDLPDTRKPTTGQTAANFNTEKFSDGIYYYRLHAGEQFANGKMVKVK